MGKNKKKRLAWLNILIVLVTLLIMSCVPGGKMVDTKYNKVLLIGIDGMDPRIIGGLMEEGRLPNFKKLADTGSFINLNTSNPPHSPVAWTSIATGSNPGKHNIFDFIRRQPGKYLPELSLSKSIGGIGGTDYEPYVKADPFWRITSKKGIATTVIRWPVSFPPERVNGNLLSGLGVPDLKGFLSGYTYYTTDDLSDKDKKSKKVVQVDLISDSIDTFVSGPKTRKSGSIVDIKEPIKIELSKDSAEITIQGNKHNVKLNKWSDWIRVKFKMSTFKNVYGIFKVNLISLDPFKMYMTTIQIDPQNPLSDISFPAKYSKDLAQDIGLYYTLGMPEETDPFIDGKITANVFLEQVDQIESERDKMFWKEFENFKKTEKGVYAFVYDSSDRIQHVFWEHKSTEKDAPIVINKVVEDYWIGKDKFIGEVLEQVDGKTLLIIMSDHGFSSFKRAVSLNTWLVKKGFMVLKKELGDEEGALFRYVDWSQTKAYSLGFNSIYVNLKGRESEGIVENKEEILNDIISELNDLEDNGKKVVNRAYKTGEIYSGEYLDNAQDIVVGYNPGFRTSWQTAVGGFTKEVITDNDKIWDGDHLIDPVFVPGTLLINAKLNVDSASQMDIVPTMLDAIGIKVPESMDGESLLR